MQKPTIKKGDKYNRLTAIKFNHKNKWGQPYWLFRCDCGQEKVINASNVKYGYVKSCGCLLKEITTKRNTSHGMAGTREYNIWNHIKDRCLNKNNSHYKNWGGRGITVCNRWLKFENFYADMGKAPTIKHSIDRINNNGNYKPENCHWANLKEQANNRRNNRLLTFNNKTMTIAQWTSKTNLKYATLYARINKYDWNIEKALTTPVNNNKNYEN